MCLLESWGLIADLRHYYLFHHSFWGRALELDVPEAVQKRFLEYTELYVDAVHEQVKNRASDKILSIDEFIMLRRDTGALKVRERFSNFTKLNHLFLLGADVFRNGGVWL